jgi:hypothetical protein
MSILALTSDTLIGTPATGNLEYDGQFFGTDSNASRAQLQRLVLSTAVASTSGTSIDFTGLPAWVKRITVSFQGVSTNGTSPVCALIGTSSGIVSTGYSAGGMRSFVASNDSVGVQTEYALPQSTALTLSMLVQSTFCTRVKHVRNNRWFSRGHDKRWWVCKPINQCRGHQLLMSCLGELQRHRNCGYSCKW